MKLFRTALLAASTAALSLFAVPQSLAPTAHADYWDRQGRRAENYWQRQGNSWERQGRQYHRDWRRETRPYWGYRAPYRAPYRAQGSVNVGPVGVWWR